MGANDGMVIGTTKILDRGPDQSCFNLVLIAEGYTADQQDQFNMDCGQFVETLNTTAPFNECGAGVNINRINISSKDSGADNPTACGGPGTSVNTYLDATFCTGGLPRLLGINQALAKQVLMQQVPAWNAAIVIVNTTTYGGSGGDVTVTSKGGPNWTLVAIHELGHAPFGLADEYEYYNGCGVDGNTRDNHPGNEPMNPNVTIKNQRDQVKWRSLILPTTPVPTTKNADCTQCDPQANPLPAVTVGLYEGANEYHCGVYRPAFDCMMRNFRAFCPVCQSIIRKALSTKGQQADLAITPWGIDQTPPTQPYWQTPDIWGTPVRGQARNDLNLRVRNVGNDPSPAFQVRVSFVPYTTLIDLANEVLIGQFTRPALAAGGVDSFVVNWDLTPPALPERFAAFDHFCVIAQINAEECNTTNNRAQNNFVNIKSVGPPPPPLRFEIANPWDLEATARLVIESSDPLLILEPLDFDPEHIPLQAGERRVVEVALVLGSVGGWEAVFQISQLLMVSGMEETQMVGGVCGSVLHTGVVIGDGDVIQGSDPVLYLIQGGQRRWTLILKPSTV